MEIMFIFTQVALASGLTILAVISSFGYWSKAGKRKYRKQVVAKANVFLRSLEPMEKDMPPCRVAEVRESRRHAAAIYRSNLEKVETSHEDWDILAVIMKKLYDESPRRKK